MLHGYSANGGFGPGGGVGVPFDGLPDPAAPERNPQLERIAVAVETIADNEKKIGPNTNVGVLGLSTGTNPNPFKTIDTSPAIVARYLMIQCMSGSFDVMFGLYPDDFSRLPDLIVPAGNPALIIPWNMTPVVLTLRNTSSTNTAQFSVVLIA